MKRQLSQLQRLLVAGIYIFIIVMIYGLLNGGIADILNQSEAASVWFFSGILLIIMGMYVTEPYFSSPTDTLSNSISLDDISEETFSRYLDTAELPDPDLMIRTSGEQRLSNYLLWQLAYAEFYFTPVAWPDFHGEELRKAVEAYENRDRRYGKV